MQFFYIRAPFAETNTKNCENVNENIFIFTICQLDADEKKVPKILRRSSQPSMSFCTDIREPAPIRIHIGTYCTKLFISTLNRAFAAFFKHNRNARIAVK